MSLAHVIDIPSNAVATRHDAPLPALHDNSMHAAVLRIISDPNTPIDRLNAALDFGERLRKMESERAFEEALHAAKAEMPPILKDRPVLHNKVYKYSHEDLPGICKVVDPILAKHGLSYRWSTSATTAGVVVVTCIIKGHGHKEENSLPAPPDASGGKNAIQAIGSAVTYLQRYTLKAALGLAAAPDDDGKDTSAEPEPDRVPTQAISYDDVTITAAQVEMLTAMIARVKQVGTKRPIDAVLAYAKAGSLAEIKVADFQRVKSGLETRLAQQEAAQ